MKGDLFIMPPEETTNQATETGVKETPAAEVQATETQAHGTETQGHETQPEGTKESKPSTETQTGVETKPAAGVEDDVERAFAARLNKERQKIEQQYNATLQRAAKIQGFDSVDAYLAAVEQAEKDAEQAEQERLYEENPTEAIRAAVQRELSVTQERDRAHQAQKAALKDKPFFTELEGEIDRIYQDGIQSGNVLDLNTLYAWAFGQRGPELIEKATKNATQSALAQVQDRARRGVVGQDNNHSDDDVDMSDIDMEMASAFGNDPKEIAKYKHQQTKRK